MRTIKDMVDIDDWSGTFGGFPPQFYKVDLPRICAEVNRQRAMRGEDPEKMKELKTLWSKKGQGGRNPPK